MIYRILTDPELLSFLVTLLGSPLLMALMSPLEDALAVRLVRTPIVISAEEEVVRTALSEVRFSALMSPEDDACALTLSAFPLMLIPPEDDV